MEPQFREPVALIVNARSAYRKAREESDSKFKKTVNGILHSLDFIEYVCLVYKHKNKSIPDTLSELGLIDAFYLNGKKLFKTDDMIEFKAAVKYLKEFYDKNGCA